MNKDSEFILEQIRYDLACEIKKLMEQNGISKQELAKRMNVSVQRVNRILSGEISSLKTLSKVLSVLVDSDVKIVLAAK